VTDGAERRNDAPATEAPTRGSRGRQGDRGNRQGNARNSERTGGRQSAAERSNARKISAEEINAQHAVTPEPAAAEAPAAPRIEGDADVSVAIFDLPVTKAQRAPRRISTHDAEQILDSVLEALPEPKQPGQGRSRVSRRASSAGAGIITTEVKE
jgi:ribonuclease E